ncbi:LysR family transcriptional regulator [Cypionkella sp.]|jgi:DNA-binding transcriptional LysR family regulator|uniref:LysR family transcriptional regulator n=1 Tax=Cypionkella sp. TaxID=2811411 RepID=UPI0027269271|nr:LysR family transcriptional regulator [Cypionkella sp.]MDO8982154.1 LysR family transcriptional regulator [Cypionkella sp.]MDP2048613.1 LysR family transcriptional regulator [Cypionkella sp.]
MTDIDTKLLRSFLTVAAERSFSRAAARLGCAQATMSQRIGQLEGLIGLPLFQRNYHDVLLTPSGKDLVPQAQQVVDAHDGFVGFARRGQVEGSVRLGIAEDYVLPMLPQLLRVLQHRLPSVELSVVTGLSRQLCQQVDARSLDMAVVTLMTPIPTARKLAEPSLHWVAAPHFLLPFDSPWPVAFFPEGCAFRSAAERQLNIKGAPHRLALISASGQVIHAAVAAGLAMTVMAAGTVPSDLRVLQHPNLPELPSTCIQVVTRAHGMSAAMRALGDVVAELW